MAVETQNEAKKYLSRLKHLSDDQRDWRAHWQEIVEYIAPRYGKFLEEGDQEHTGEKRHGSIIEQTATRALRILAAGMQGGLTSPARPWFRLGFADVALNEWGPVKAWLHDTEKRMYNVFARSNFYTQIHGLYSELGAFGTAVTLEEEDYRDIVRFRNCTIGQFYLATNSLGRVDTVYRLYPMTAKHMVGRFGEGKVSDGVRNAYKTNPYTWFQVVHACQPRKDYDDRKLDALNMPWESVYLEYKDEKAILSKSGYREFPYMAPRWDVSGVDVMGRSPGMDVLAEVKRLQEIETTSLMALHKEVDPPVLIPTALRGIVDLLPGGITFADIAATGQAGALYNVKMNIGETEAKIDRIRMAVREGFYNDMFLMLIEPRQMTATEVMERHEEKLLMLGPVIERQIHELLDPVIDRTFAIMLRNGHISPPPEEVFGLDMKVEYISILAQAQKMVATKSIQSTLNFVAAIAEVHPQAWDKIDIDQTIDEYSDAVGAPGSIVRSDDDVKVIRERRAEQERQQAEMEKMMAMIQSGKELSETSTGPGEGDNALLELQRMIGGGRA